MKAITKTMSAAALLLATGVASAASYTYTLSYSEAGLASDDFAYVTLTNVGDDLSISVDVNGDAFTVASDSDNFGMDKFYFEASDLSGISSSNISVTTSGWKLSKQEDKNVSSLGIFDFEFTGTGENRINADETLEITIKGILAGIAEEDLDLSSYLVANEDGWVVSAHVGGFLMDGIDSTFIAGGISDGSTPVPLPAPLVLFGSGLMALAGFGRRRKS